MRAIRWKYSVLVLCGIVALAMSPNGPTGALQEGGLPASRPNDALAERAAAAFQGLREKVNRDRAELAAKIESRFHEFDEWVEAKGDWHALSGRELAQARDRIELIAKDLAEELRQAAHRTFDSAEKIVGRFGGAAPLPSEGGATVVAGLPTPVPEKVREQRVTRERVSINERKAANWAGNWEGEWEETLFDKCTRCTFTMLLTSEPGFAGMDDAWDVAGVAYGSDGNTATVTGEIMRSDDRFELIREYKGYGVVRDSGRLVRNPQTGATEVHGTWQTGNGRRGGTWRMWPVQ